MGEKQVYARKSRVGFKQVKFKMIVRQSSEIFE